MGFLSWQTWFGDHLYGAVLIAAILEGLGLPIPTEALFIPAAVLARTGQASLPLVVALATLGNMIGGSIGFGVAYWGGPAFLRQVSRWIGIKPEAVRRMERFFAQYGEATVFISRFVGPIRAATLYSAGAARMSPVPYALYLLLASLLFNAGWVVLIWRFQHRIARLLAHGGPGWWLPWAVALLLLLILWRYGVRLFHRRTPSDR